MHTQNTDRQVDIDRQIYIQIVRQTTIQTDRYNKIDSGIDRYVGCQYNNGQLDSQIDKQFDRQIKLYICTVKYIINCQLDSQTDKQIDG